MVTNNVRVKIKNFREFGAGTRTLTAFDVPVLEADYCQKFYPSFDLEQHICTGGRGKWHFVNEGGLFRGL